MCRRGIHEGADSPRAWQDEPAGGPRRPPTLGLRSSLIPKSLLNTAPSLPLHRVCMLNGQSPEHLLSLVRAGQAARWKPFRRMAVAIDGRAILGSSQRPPTHMDGTEMFALLVNWRLGKFLLGNPYSASAPLVRIPPLRTYKITSSDNSIPLSYNV
jgi:hypothetical protein